MYVVWLLDGELFDNKNDTKIEEENIVLSIYEKTINQCE